MTSTGGHWWHTDGSVPSACELYWAHPTWENVSWLWGPFHSNFTKMCLTAFRHVACQKAVSTVGYRQRMVRSHWSWLFIFHGRERHAQQQCQGDKAAYTTRSHKLYPSQHRLKKMCRNFWKDKSTWSTINTFFAVLLKDIPKQSVCTSTSSALNLF